MKEGKSQGGIVRRENTAKSQSKKKPSRAVKKGEWKCQDNLEQEAPRGGDGYVSAQGGCLQDTF